jgi:2-polyprenyl-3-methyl-5-hydroxy-6-metoxy-1,4-benzoquinol methylase
MTPPERSARDNDELAAIFDEFFRQHRAGSVDAGLRSFILKTLQEIYDGYCWTGGTGRGQDGTAPTASVRWAPNPSLNHFKRQAMAVLAPSRGDRILDIGSGFGTYVVWCAQQGASCVGIDRDPRKVVLANYFLRQHGLEGRLVCMDASAIGFADASFAKVMSGDFYEHIDDRVKRAMLTDARRILKPGGLIVLKTPNLSYLRLSLWAKRGRAVLRGHNPFSIHIPETPESGVPNPEHIGLATIRKCQRDLAATGFRAATPCYFPGFKLQPYLGVANRPLTTRLPTRTLLAEEVVIKAFAPRRS